MFKFLFFIVFLFILLVLLMGFSVVRMFKRMLFGGGESGQRRNAHTSGNQQSRSRDGQQNQPKHHPSARKIFREDEGEYVEYEEIK